MSHAANSFMRVLLFALVLLQVVHVPTAVGEESEPRPSNGKGGAIGAFPDEKIDINGVSREYRLVVPKSIESSKPVPILFAFHGFLIDNKDLMAAYSQLDKLAEQEGFVLVFPNAVNRAWKLLPALAKDDFAFFDQLLAHLSEQYNLDRNRDYLCGMSNGAYFSHLLASQRSDVVAAIGCHSGGLGVLSRREPSVKHKYGVFIAHGEDDSIVKVDEGRKARDAYQKWGFPHEYLEVPKHNHFWATKADVNTKMWKFMMAHPLDAK